MGVGAEQIVVVVIQDGILKMKQSVYDFFDDIDETLEIEDSP